MLSQRLETFGCSPTSHVNVDLTYVAFREAQRQQDAAECRQRVLARPIDKSLRERLEVRLAKLKLEADP